MSPWALPNPAEILVVGDDPGTTERVREALREGRWRKNVHAARAGEEALAFLSGQGGSADAARPDLVLMDLSSPAAGSAEGVAAMREAAPSVPVVAFVLLDGGEPVRGWAVARFVRDALIRSRVDHERTDAPVSEVLVTTRALLLTLPDGTGARTRQGIDHLRQLAGRMRRLRRSLPGAAESEAGRLAGERRPTSPWDLIEEVMDRYQPVAEERGIRLVDLTLERDLPGIRADGAELREALSTLVAHTLDLAPDGCRVVLWADASGDEVHFYGGDEGPGMAEEHLPRLFDPFADAWRAVAAHGGWLSMSSRPGKGSSFGFGVPCG